MARTHDWTGAVHNLTIEEDSVAMGYAFAGSGSANIFAETWEQHTYTADVSPAGILSILVPSFFNGVTKAPAGARFMRLNFYTSPTINCIPYMLTNAQQAFFGVPTLYVDATAGPSIYTYDGGWSYNSYVNGYYLAAPFATRFEQSSSASTAFLLVDSSVGKFLGLNAKKCVDLSGLMQDIAQDLVDAGDTPSVFYTSTEYDGAQFKSDMANWIGTETSGDVYNYIGAIESDYAWEEQIGIDISTPHTDIIFSRILSYIVNNFQTESIVPNYYNYNWRKPETWNYDFTINEESGRVTVYATKVYGGIHFSNVVEVQPFMVGNTTLGVKLEANHKFMLRNASHDLSRVVGELVEDGEDAKTYKFAFQLYELISTTDDYLDYLEDPDSYITTYLENNFFVETSATVHCYGILNYEKFTWTYASGLTGANATPITYNYAIPIKHASDNAGNNVSANQSGLTPAFIAYAGELEGLAGQVISQLGSVLAQLDITFFQELIDLCNSIIGGALTTSTWLIENASFNYIESTKTPDEYYPSSDDPEDETPRADPMEEYPTTDPTHDPVDPTKIIPNATPAPVPTDTPSANTPNLGNMYQFDNITDLNYFTTSLWGPNVDWDNLLALFDNPLDGIYSLMAFPCDFPHGNDHPTVYCGNVAVVKDANTPYACERVTTKYTTIEFAFTVEGRYHSFLDYAPYTQVQLHVPYYGLVDLPLDKVMYHNCKLIYYIDANTGTARAQIKVYYDYEDAGVTKTGRYIVWESDIQIGVELPVSGSNWNRKLASTLCNLGEMVLNPVSGAVGVLQSATAPNTVSKTGSYMANTSILADRTVYLIYNQPQWQDIAQYNHTIGRKCNLNYKLGNLVGFTKTYDVDVSGIPATSEELDMIKSYLDSGVIL